MTTLPAEKLPLQWLEALLLFAEAPSMEIAARQLGLTQPALSKQLKSLESRLALPLFAQEGKRKVLTAYGQELVAELKPRLQGLDENIRQVRLKHVDGAKAEIHICARREVLDRLSSKLKFAGRVYFSEAAHDEILRKLVGRESDLAITYEAPDSVEFHARPLFRETFQFLIPKTRLARRPVDENLATALTKIPAVAYRPQDEILEAAARSINLQPPIDTIRVTDNYDSLFRMIEAGIGWGVVPSHFEPKNSWSIKIAPKWIQGREFRLIYRKELAKARWMKELLTEVSQTFTPKEQT